MCLRSGIGTVINVIETEIILSAIVTGVLMTC